MAVTFTNKAALEMRSRIEELLQAPMMDGWVVPFMVLLIKCLNASIKKLVLSSGFTILDSDDQLRIIKRISKELGLDEATWPSRQSQWQINSWKDEGLEMTSLTIRETFSRETIKKIYKEYEATCLRDNLVDFGELLLNLMRLSEIMHL